MPFFPTLRLEKGILPHAASLSSSSFEVVVLYARTGLHQPFFSIVINVDQSMQKPWCLVLEKSGTRGEYDLLVVLQPRGRKLDLEPFPNGGEEC